MEPGAELQQVSVLSWTYKERIGNEQSCWSLARSLITAMISLKLCEDYGYE